MARGGHADEALDDRRGRGQAELIGDWGLFDVRHD